MQTTTKVAIGLLALACLSGQATASDTSISAGFTAHNQFSESEKNPQLIKTIKVKLFVRIPRQNLNFSHFLVMFPGTTAGGAVEAVYKVEHGLVCCDSRDVRGINGLKIYPHKEKWWIVKVNGNRQNTSSRTILKDGDVVEWIYDEMEGYEPKHIRLEEWVGRQMRK